MMSMCGIASRPISVATSAIRTSRPFQSLPRPTSSIRYLAAGSAQCCTRRATGPLRRVPGIRGCRVAASAGDAGNDEQGRKSLQDLSKLLTKSFLEACMSQPGVEYRTALRAFAGAAKEAYQGGASVAAVSLQWQMSQGTGTAALDEFLQQRGGLMEDEVELRSSWISTCFLAFSEAGVTRDEPPVAGDAGLDQERLAVFVKNVTELARRGYNVQRVKLEEVMAMTEESPPRSEMESAALTQAIRLIFTALEAAGAQTYEGEPIIISSSPTAETPEPTQAKPDGSEQQQGDPAGGRKDTADAAAARSARFKARYEAEGGGVSGGRSSSSGTATASADTVEDEAALRKKLGYLRARELKARLSEMGVDSSSCFDKEGLVDKLVTALLQGGSQTAPADAAPESSSGTKAPPPDDAPEREATPATADDGAQAEAELRKELSSLRASELKTRLKELGVDSSSCFDKEGLVDKLATALAQGQGSAKHSGGIAVPLIWRQATPLFAGISVDKSEYMGIELNFRNGPTSFHIDTAASHNIITPLWAQKSQSSATGASTSGQAATGTVGLSHEVTLGTAELGGVQLQGADFRAVVMQAPVSDDCAGLIGLTFLDAFEAVEFRWDKRPGEAEFHPKGSVSWDVLSQDLTTVMLEKVGNGLLCTRVCVGQGEPILALVDTGAPFTVANRAAGVRIDPSIPPMAVSGADGSPIQLGVSEGRPEIRLPGSNGGLVLGSAALLVGDLPGFALINANGNTPALILGLDILAQRPRLMFSSATQRMAL